MSAKSERSIKFSFPFSFWRSSLGLCEFPSSSVVVGSYLFTLPFSKLRSVLHACVPTGICCTSGLASSLPSYVRTPAILGRGILPASCRCSSCLRVLLCLLCPNVCGPLFPAVFLFVLSFPIFPVGFPCLRLGQTLLRRIQGFSCSGS